MLEEQAEKALAKNVMQIVDKYLGAVCFSVIPVRTKSFLDRRKYSAQYLDKNLQAMTL